MYSLLKFTALTLALYALPSEPPDYSCRLDVEGTVTNANNIRSVQIFVKFPNGDCRLIRINPANFIPVQNMTYRLKLTMLLINLTKAQWGLQGMLFCVYSWPLYCVIICIYFRE